MIELAFLALWDRLVNWGLAPIVATRAVAADGRALRSVLSQSANQWRLANGFAEIDALQPANERCTARLRLPLGLHVRASLSAAPRTPRVLVTDLAIGDRPIGWATWILSPGRGTTEIDLAVQLASRSLATRLWLLLGGRRWIARRLDMALATLATTTARALEHGVTPPATEPVPAPRTHRVARRASWPSARHIRRLIEGPAVFPQPRYEVRANDGRIELRRAAEA
jgi:hypothetical protein